MNIFIEKPSTIEDFKNNVHFQVENVKGWLSVNDYESALIKAKCLVEALQAIVAAEESERVYNKVRYLPERTLDENVKDFRESHGGGLGPEDFID